MDTEETKQAAEDPEEITLMELGEECRKTEECLKCRYIEHCNAFSRFMSRIRPKWWLGLAENTNYHVPDLKLFRDGTFSLKKPGESNGNI